MRTPVALALLSALLFAACGGGASTPTQVAEKFLTHLNKKEFSDAKKYGTAETGKTLELLSAMASMMGNEAAKPFKITGEKIDGDKATVTYRTEGEEADKTLELVKDGDKWLVVMKKETPDMDMGMEDVGMEDMDMEGMEMEAEMEAMIDSLFK